MEIDLIGCYAPDWHIRGIQFQIVGDKSRNASKLVKFDFVSTPMCVFAYQEFSWILRCLCRRFVQGKGLWVILQCSFVPNMSLSRPRPELSFTGWTLVGYYHVVSSTDDPLSSLSAQLSSHWWYSSRGHIDPNCLDTVILFYMLWESQAGNCPCRDICYLGLSMLIRLLMRFIHV